MYVIWHDKQFYHIKRRYGVKLMKDLTENDLFETQVALTMREATLHKELSRVTDLLLKRDAEIARLERDCDRQCKLKHAACDREERLEGALRKAIFECECKSDDYVRGAVLMVCRKALDKEHDREPTLMGSR